MNDNVIDANEKIRLAKDIATFCRLVRIVDGHEAAVRADPMAFLRRAADMIMALEVRIEEIRRVLHPQPVQIVEGDPIEIASPGEDAARMIGTLRQLVDRPLELPEDTA